MFDEKTGLIEEAFHEISELKADKLETVPVFSRATSIPWSGGPRVEIVVAVQRAKAQAARKPCFEKEGLIRGTAETISSLGKGRYRMIPTRMLGRTEALRAEKRSRQSKCSTECT